MKNITKRFPGVVANDAITLGIRKGEIHSLVGENGSGKSTLMSILYGLYHADSGEILFKGKKVEIGDSRAAIDLGLGMVFQHFMLVDTLTVAENVILRAEPARYRFVDYRQAQNTVKKLASDYGLRVDPRARISDISVGQQQRVEILKALYRHAQILILDEPTAVLTPQETEELFQVMRNLKQQGTTIVFITHKIKEVLAISDRVSVLRRGKLMGTRNTAETNHRELAEMVVGREVLLRVEKKPSEPRETVASIAGLTVKDRRGTTMVKDVSLEVRSGEVLGIAGVEGNGQQQLVEAITGLIKPEAGKVMLHGQPIQKLSPMNIKKRGVSYIPEDRHKRGLILDYNVADNLILGLHTQHPFVERYLFRNEKQIDEHARRLVADYDIRPTDIRQIVRTFSGGNQQKVVVAREFSRKPQFLICSQPTRGLDIGAIEFIHQEIIRQRDQGTAVLLVSAELDEILSLSDRIAVMYEGRIVTVLPAAESDERRLGYLMLGGDLHRTEGVEIGTSAE
ncbi:MAG: ABC transporter ATP-binding protein [Spirochaetaceae bacterium]|nr:MAG: ABC transporter ATP-binding protein [Spirochaetaceae bacterium]